MAKRTYTSAEKQAFRAGMRSQYNKDHPVFNYAGTVEYTTYDERGRKDGSPRYGRIVYFKTEDEAKQFAAKHKSQTALSNEIVMEAVKAKKVDVYNSSHCTTERAVYKRISPTRKANDPLVTYGNIKTPAGKKR